MYTSTELIDSIILELNKLEVKGVANMAIVIDAIQKLSALKNGLSKEKEEKAVTENDSNSDSCPG